MLNSYILLAISILAEAIASSFVVATKGFTNPKPTIICMLGYSISYGRLALPCWESILGSPMPHGVLSASS